MKAFTVTQHFGVWQENSQTWSRELKNVVTAVFEDDAIINTPSPNEFEIFYILFLGRVFNYDLRSENDQENPLKDFPFGFRQNKI